MVPVLDQWVHLALVYDGQSLALYRNGNLSAQGGAKTSIPVRSSVAFTDHGGYAGALQIGSVNNEPADHNWNGLIDDFAVFTGALDESQVQLVMGGQFAVFQNNAPLLSLTRSGSAARRKLGVRNASEQHERGDRVAGRRGLDFVAAHSNPCGRPAILSGEALSA